ncbi:MAG TPA: polyprenol monophosphomannose synthase [Flavobacteriales bacterium]|nr:polyprenol monophosphomannose synthase [Flavobacteriales bacterium]
MPTFNEQENIRAIVEHVLGLPKAFDVLVVDDNSQDGTADTVKALQSERTGRVHLIQRAGKLGLGTAYIAGFKWALAQGYARVFEMDADFSHNPDDLLRLDEACVSGGGDMSVGSRYVKGGGVSNWSWDRVMLSYCASLYVRMVLWLGVKDTTAGFVCYKRETLLALPLDDVRFIGYAFQIEMKYRVRLAGLRIVEVPITFQARELVTSKMNSSIFKEAIVGVLKMCIGSKRK